MTLRLVTPPATTIISLAECKAHLRILFDDDDSYIESLIDVAIAHIDGADGWLNRAVISQTWDYAIDKFPCVKHDGAPARIYLPFAPLISIDSVTYTDTQGASATITDYRVKNVGGSQAGYIVPALNSDWPSSADEPEAVVVRFTAGFATVPPAIKHALLLMVGHWYENREAATETKMSDLPMAVGALLNPYRFWAPA